MPWHNAMDSLASRPSKLVELLSNKSGNPNLTIVDTILFHLGIADVYSLQASSRSLRWLVNYMTASPCLLSITKQLQPFVVDPTQFRSELGRHGGLIAGDFVRNFFEFGRWQVNSLFLYVERGSKCQGLIRYLLQHEGYRTYSEKLVFRRDRDPDLFIIIKSTRDPPIIDIINEATTTAGLNFISWNKAYCLLPVPTIRFHKFYTLKPFDNTIGQSLRQRAKLGWTTRDLLWPDLTKELISDKECRQIGGPSTLIINLGSNPPGDYTPDYVLERSVYSVVWKSTGSSRRLVASMKLSPMSHALLYPHTNGDIGDGCKDWWSFLRERLDRWVYVEVVKTDYDLRPHGFYFLAPGNFRISIPAGYQVPDTWDYADDQIIPWFQEWERGWTRENVYQ
ncbi:hypothetical protein FSPOR_4312 [Fusarium sporotrichioides]|uniref:Uncharacterized protein n=1 Tax=Fusarium sporotrichioides TaxID=5514 RepID=A0A395SC80_FUSSP|nr:hypothetical protein FSPOR_4312 [Fusarium sporotrichioides]